MVSLLKLWGSFVKLVKQQGLEVVQLAMSKIRNNWSCLPFLTSIGLSLGAKDRSHSASVLSVLHMRLWE